MEILFNALVEYYTNEQSMWSKKSPNNCAILMLKRHSTRTQYANGGCIICKSHDPTYKYIYTLKYVANIHSNEI